MEVVAGSPYPQTCNPEESKQAHKQARKKASKQSSTQESKQASKQTGKQARKKASKQAFCAEASDILLTGEARMMLPSGLMDKVPPSRRQFPGSIPAGHLAVHGPLA